MAIYFSPSMKGFYDDKLKVDYQNSHSWPDDLVEISERWYAYLLQKQSEGKVISFNEYGQPVAQEPESIMSDETSAWQAEMKKKRLLAEAEAVIAPLVRAEKYGMVTDSERNVLEAWERYTVSLSRVDTSEPEWPEPPQNI
ncbi:tail fiber assembly protein [Escherichia marmotae]|uniref:Tail fiber assembly protein n=1 Tax=Escherichia marmotae TaxID=1499973 RepID=A0A7H9K1F8_9ESCH|nr:tail fiber assembly protein [Escherichia marmotae]QLU99710.1 tail fiber assembly protein [Escherichia marmotae]